MPTTKLTVGAAAGLIGKTVKLPASKVREVLDAFDRLSEQALLAGHEVEVGSMGYLRLAEPKNTLPPQGEVTRGKRVAFREKDANRHRWK